MVEQTNIANSEKMLKTLYAANLKISTIIHSGDFQKIAGELEQAVSSLIISLINYVGTDNRQPSE